MEIPAVAEPRLVSVDQFCRTSTVELDWIVPGRIPKPAMILLAGEPKAGKSFLSVDVCNQIASGGLVFGVPAKPSRVLYLTTDAREAVWRHFFQELIDAGVVFHPNFQLVASAYWHRPANVLSEATFEWTRTLLVESRPDVVCLDVLRDFHNGDENDSTSMKLVFDRLERLFKDVCLILNHHAKKVPDDVPDPKPQNYIRGSSYMMGKVDDLWFLHSKPGSEFGTLKIDGRMGGKALKYTGTRQQPSGLWHFKEAEEERTKALQCAELCMEFPTQSHNQLADIAVERFKVSRSSYFRYLKVTPCAHKPAQSVVEKGSTVTSAVDTKENEDLTMRSIFGNLFHTCSHSYHLEIQGGQTPDVNLPVQVTTPAL